MGKTGYTDEDIVATLEKVGAGPMLARLTEGIQTAVTEKDATFSSGERQLMQLDGRYAQRQEVQKTVGGA